MYGFRAVFGTCPDAGARALGHRRESERVFLARVVRDGWISSAAQPRFSSQRLFAGRRVPMPLGPVTRAAAQSLDRLVRHVEQEANRRAVPADRE